MDPLNLKVYIMTTLLTDKKASTKTAFALGCKSLNGKRLDMLFN